MAYTVKLKPSAVRDFKRLDRSAQKRVASKIDALAEDPIPSGVARLEGKGNLYRIRAGDYRIVYQVRDDVLLVLVVKIGHRRDIYRNL